MKKQETYKNVIQIMKKEIEDLNKRNADANANAETYHALSIKYAREKNEALRIKEKHYRLKEEYREELAISENLIDFQDRNLKIREGLIKTYDKEMSSKNLMLAISITLNLLTALSVLSFIIDKYI